MDNDDYGQQINNTLGKMLYYLQTHNSIVCSVSGGSDSNVIVHIIATYFREFLPKIHFVFSNTGLEWKATIKHLDYLEKRYDIKIDRTRGMSVVTACRKFGVPIVSKRHSKVINAFCRDIPYALKNVYATREETGGGLTSQSLLFV